VTPALSAAIPAAITFAVAEVICRLLLHLPDKIVPLVVLPATFLAWGVAMRYLRTRRSP
jgi:hypothetical protein